MIDGGENDFADMNIENWEDRVFTNAAHFTVVKKVGVGKMDRKEFPNFVEAINDAFTDERAMVYAVTESGRAVMLVRKKWRHYYDLLNTKRGKPSVQP